jgi:hypothetical protein
MRRDNKKQQYAGEDMLILELEEHNRVMPPMRLTGQEPPVTQRRTPKIGDAVFSVWGRVSGTVVDYPIQGAPDGLTVQVELKGNTRYLLWNTHTPRTARLVLEGDWNGRPHADYAIIEAPAAVALKSPITALLGLSMFLPWDAWANLPDDAEEDEGEDDA